MNKKKKKWWLFKIRSCLWADGAQGLNVQVKGVLGMVAQPVCPGQGGQTCSPATTELILFKACVLLCFFFCASKELGRQDFEEKFILSA